MQLRTFGVTVIFLSTVVALPHHTKSCKYWCKSQSSYYCCPTGKPEHIEKPATMPIIPWPSIFWPSFIGSPIGLWHGHHQHESTPKKKCPPLRSTCSRSLDWYGPPNLCNSDEDCGSWDKCCYDVCLEHKTCKPSE